MITDDITRILSDTCFVWSTATVPLVVRDAAFLETNEEALWYVLAGPTASEYDVVEGLIGNHKITNNLFRNTYPLGFDYTLSVVVRRF